MNISNLKQTIIDNFDPKYEMASDWDENSIPLDFRYYLCDGEDVFEQDGIINLLKELKPTFDKIDFICVISNHFEEWDDDDRWINHRITINDNDYIIFENFKESGWGDAPLRISQILNKELEIQGIEERVYLASGGNDGRLVFLNKELYNYIYSIYKPTEWRPLELKEWAKMNRLQYIQY